MIHPGMSTINDILTCVYAVVGVLTDNDASYSSCGKSCCSMSPAGPLRGDRASEREGNGGDREQGHIHESGRGVDRERKSIRTLICSWSICSEQAQLPGPVLERTDEVGQVSLFSTGRLL